MNITLARALELKTECQNFETSVEAIDKHLNPYLAQAKDKLGNIPDILLKYSGERFIYMVWCTPDWQGYLYSWIQFYHELFDQESLANILLKLNRIMHVNFIQNTFIVLYYYLESRWQAISHLDQLFVP